MKRSEMVTVIADVLIRNEIEPYVSATILDAMEEAGMLPPFNNHDFYNDGDKADEMRITYRTWEKE